MMEDVSVFVLYQKSLTHGIYAHEKKKLWHNQRVLHAHFVNNFETLK